MNKTKIAKIAWAICLLVAIVLSFKSLREPDLWWMYRTGEFMLETGAVTKTDPFSYTMAGTEWINVKWLFELLISLGKNLFGVEGVFVFQALVSLGILGLIYQSSNLIRQKLKAENTPKTPFIGLVLAALFLLYTIDYRLIGRPEMTSHLLTTAYLFLFWKHHIQPSSKAIFALIPLQLLWSNMHEAFGIGMVLMVAYLGATFVEYFYLKNRKITVEFPKKLSLTVLAALAVIVINPRGYLLWLHPFNIFGQLGSNQYTTELFSISKIEYWLEIQAYLNFVFLAIAALFVLFTPFAYRKIKPQTSTSKLLNYLDNLIQNYGLGNLLLLLMLFYLSTTAYRNIPFFALAATPILAVALDFGFQKINYPKWIYPTTALLAFGFYISIITGKYHEWSGSKDQYGLQVLSSHNPVGAANFIQKNNIQGKCFADYLTSSYLLWALQPNFKTYIDLRDLDIFPPSFFQDFTETSAIPARFEAKDDSLNFDYVVLFRPQFQFLQQHLLGSTNYDLVYIDPVAAVYVKNTDAHFDIITKYGFAKNGAKDIFSALEVVPSSAAAYWLSKIFNPLYQPTDYSKTNQDALAGAYFNTLGSTDLALARAAKAIQNPAAPWQGYGLEGDCYTILASSPSAAPSMRSTYQTKASTAYQNALRLQADYIPAKIGLAGLFMQQGNFTAAISSLFEIQELAPNNITVISYLALCYKNLAYQNNQDQSTTQMWLDWNLKLQYLSPDNPMTLLDIGLAYCLLNDCAKAKPYLDKIKNIEGLPTEEMKTIKKCLANCSL